MPASNYKCCCSRATRVWASDRFNEALFQLAGVPYDAASFTNTTGDVFPSWETEDADWFKIASKFFSPVRMPYPDVALVTNFAITPQMRVAQMTFWASLFPGHAMQVRSCRFCCSRCCCCCCCCRRA